jgi:energy-coupling factor transport system permease protein
MKSLQQRFQGLIKLFVILFLMQIIFRNEGNVYMEWGIVKITDQGVNYGLISTLRITLIILLAALLFQRPFYDYLLAFHSWHFPYEISFLIASVINFIPTYRSQFLTIKENLYLRGIYFRKLTLFQRFRTVSQLIFPVLSRALLQVKDRAIALELRGFRLYKNRTFIYEHKLAVWDWLIQLFCLLLLVFIVKGQIL